MSDRQGWCNVDVITRIWLTLKFAYIPPLVGTLNNVHVDLPLPCNLLVAGVSREIFEDGVAQVVVFHVETDLWKRVSIEMDRQWLKFSVRTAQSLEASLHLRYIPARPRSAVL